MNDKTPHELWLDCLAILKDLVPQVIYQTYFEPCDIVYYDGREVKILVPSDYYHEYIEDKQISKLRRALFKVFGKDLLITYRVSVKRGSGTLDSTSAQYPAKPEYPQRNQNTVVLPTEEARKEQNAGARNITIDPQLHPDFCYEHLVTGGGNSIAYGVCRQAVQEFSSHRMKDPLFFFGDPGVGKTHLIQSMGLEFRKLFPNLIVHYVTANQFTELFSDACLRKRMKGENEAVNEIEAYYKSINLLIVDDLQELATRYTTQNFLSNIIEHMQRNNCQFVCASSQAPANLVSFRGGLLSQLKSGRIIPIESLDLEKRVEVLQQRAKRDGIEHFPEEVFHYMSEHVRSNIRELIGVYLSLMAMATFSQRAITLELAKEVIKNNVGEQMLTKLTIDDIKRVVSQYYRLRVDELCETTRRAEIVEPRQIAMFLAKEYTQTPLMGIGEQLGRKSHSTVLHATKTVQDRMDSSREFQERVEAIKKELHIEQ